MADIDEVVSRLERLESGQRAGRFDRLSVAYGDDADAAGWRAASLAMMASVIVTGGVGWGAYQIAASDTGRLGPGIAVAVLGMLASVPVWWLADRYRRLSNESRRLQRHVLAIEPYLAGFSADQRDRVQLYLAQRLFARASEDNDPLSRPIWPLDRDNS